MCNIQTKSDKTAPQHTSNTGEALLWTCICMTEENREVMMLCGTYRLINGLGRGSNTGLEDFIPTRNSHSHHGLGNVWWQRVKNMLKRIIQLIAWNIQKMAPRQRAQLTTNCILQSVVMISSSCLTWSNKHRLISNLNNSPLLRKSLKPYSITASAQIV